MQKEITLDKVSSNSHLSIEDAVTRDNSKRHNTSMANATLNEIQATKNAIEQQTDTIKKFSSSQEKVDKYFLEKIEDLNEVIWYFKEMQKPTKPVEELKQEQQPIKEEIDFNNKTENRKGFL